MSKPGKLLRPVLYKPKKIAGVSLIHPLHSALMPSEIKARREKNDKAKISRRNHRKRKPHGRSA